MTLEMRREGRKGVGRLAWLNACDGRPLFSCTLVDISNGGAKLTIDEVDQIPPTFSLWLSRHGHPRYSCQIVWRCDDVIGVKFVAS